MYNEKMDKFAGKSEIQQGHKSSQTVTQLSVIGFYLDPNWGTDCTSS